MKTRTDAVAEVAALLENRDTGIWFASLAESGPEAIEAQGWQLKEVLSDRGMKVSLRDVQDAMLELAHELLPDSAAGEDPRDRLTGDLGHWATGQPQEVRDRLRALLEGPGYQEAHDAGSVAEFRKFLRDCCMRAMRGEAA